MSDEHDSWLKDAFGLDLGASLGSIKDDAAAALGQAASAVTQTVQSVQGAVEGALDGVTGVAAGVVKKVAGAVSPSRTAGAGGSAGGGTGTFPLGGSVGRGGKNAANDVRAVQTALGITADGQCGGQTIAAIEAYQRKLGQPKPDGRVDAGGATERALARGASPADAPSPSPAAADGDGSGGLLGQLQKGAAGLIDDAQGLGGQLVKGAEGLLGDAGQPAGDAPDGGGGLLGGLSGALGNPGNLLSDLEAGGTTLAIEVSLGEQEIPAGGKVKVTVELKATGSAKVKGLSGTELSIGKDGPAFKVATTVWNSDAKVKVAGVDLFRDPKLEFENKGDKKGIVCKVNFVVQTQIGELTASFALLELKTESIRSPTFGALAGELKGIPTSYPDKEINGIKFTGIEIRYSGELKVGVDMVKILAQRAAERALQQGALTIGADVIIAGSFIVGGVATIAGAVYQIAFGFALKDLTERFASNLQSLEAGFRAGMSDAPAPGDPYGKKGHELGQQNLKKLIDRTREQNPQASEEQIKAAVVAKAGEATQEAIDSGQVAASLKNGMWDGLLAEGKWIFTAKDAATAYQACGLGNDPRFDAKAASTPQWQAYLKQYPTQSKL
jgi:hypothetical protein